MANDIQEASQKVKDRTGRGPVLITLGMEDLEDGPLVLEPAPQITLHQKGVRDGSRRR